MRYIPAVVFATLNCLKLMALIVGTVGTVSGLGNPGSILDQVTLKPLREEAVTSTLNLVGATGIGHQSFVFGAD